MSALPAVPGSSPALATAEPLLTDLVGMGGRALPLRFPHAEPEAPLAGLGMLRRVMPAGTVPPPEPGPEMRGRGGGNAACLQVKASPGVCLPQPPPW